MVSTNTHNIEQAETLKLISLSPTSNCEDGEELNAQAYFEAIDNALKDSSIYNIGIVGSYGSGKSSIIKSFEKKHPEYNIQNISLASFVETVETSKPSDDKTDNTEKLLEYSIIQQILYKVTPEKLPKSRFKRIHSNICYWKSVSVIMAFIASQVILLEPEWLSQSSLWESITWDKYWLSLAALIVLIITSW